MALIKCSECGREVSDKADKCVGCGHVFREEHMTRRANPPGARKCAKCGDVIVDTRSTHCPNCGHPIEKKGIARIASKIGVDKKQTKILAVAVVAVLVVVVFAFLSCSGMFDSDKRLAIDSAKSYRNALKNPESLSIRSDFTIVRIKNDDGQTEEYRYFSATSQTVLGEMFLPFPCALMVNTEWTLRVIIVVGAQTRFLAMAIKLPRNFNGGCGRLTVFQKTARFLRLTVKL